MMDRRYQAMQMDRRYQVMQFVAVVRGTWGRFRVFRTGERGWYLFDQIDRWDCSTTIQFPVRAADLRPDIRRALAHGWGNSL